MTKAKGHRRSERKLKIAVCFDPDSFEDIRQRAVRDNTSFGEQVRRLVEWGLEADQPQEPKR